MKLNYWMVGLAVVSAAGSASLANGEAVTAERLLAAGTEAEMGNWLTVHKTHDSNRYSTLNEYFLPSFLFLSFFILLASSSSCFLPSYYFLP